MTRTVPASLRFWAKVDIQELEPSPCWLWLGGKNSSGYGYFYYEGRHVRAHRWAYEQSIGPIPEGLQLDHLCRVRACVNPAHLEPVTGKENYRRGEGAPAKNGRKTHCVRGHAFTPENTAIRPGGGRTCRTCRRKHWSPNRKGPDCSGGGGARGCAAPLEQQREESAHPERSRDA